jgi:uncharacterized protein (DUF983 family)
MAQSQSAPSTLAVALRARCPRCGKGALFHKAIQVKPRCEACGLDYKFIDTGDGPAVFAILLLGIIVLGGALIAEFRYGVPVWAHVVLWGVLTPLLALGMLRILKGALIALQYKHKAEPGRLQAD